MYQINNQTVVITSHHEYYLVELLTTARTGTMTLQAAPHAGGSDAVGVDLLPGMTWHGLD